MDSYNSEGFRWVDGIYLKLVNVWDVDYDDGIFVPIRSGGDENHTRRRTGEYVALRGSKAKDAGEGILSLRVGSVGVLCRTVWKRSSDKLGQCR